MPVFLLFYFFSKDANDMTNNKGDAGGRIELKYFLPQQSFEIIGRKTVAVQMAILCKCEVHNVFLCKLHLTFTLEVNIGY